MPISKDRRGNLADPHLTTIIQDPVTGETGKAPDSVT